jgi:hypothetical protein
MADELTPNLGLTKPDVGASDDTWGEKLNINFDILDQLKSAFISDDPPDIPAPGMLWWHASTGALYIYYDDVTSQQWVEVGRAPTSGGGSSSGSNVTTSDSPPTSAVDGDLWWESNTGRVYIYYDDGSSSQWVEIGSAGSSSSGELNFIQAGAGAVTRTMQDKARETISVKDFGAVGNGFDDDTAAIQAAINAAGPTNSTVYFPAGRYVAVGLVISPTAGGWNNPPLVGDGARSSAIVRPTNTNGHMLTINYLDGSDAFWVPASTRISGLEFFGFGGTATTGHSIHCPGNTTPGAYGYAPWLEDVIFIHSPEHCLNLGQNRNFGYFHNCVGLYSNKAVLNMLGCGDHCFTKCVFGAPQFVDSPVAVLSSAFSVKFYGCDFHDAQQACGVVIDSQYSFVSFTDCVINSNAQHGVLISGTGTALDEPTSFTSCFFSENSLQTNGGYHNIAINNRANVAIIGCKFSAPGVGGTNLPGYHVGIAGTPGDVVFEGNIIVSGSMTINITNQPLVLTDCGQYQETSLPTIASGSGTITAATGNMRSIRNGNLISVSADCAITDNGSGATDIRFPIPYGVPQGATFGHGGELSLANQMVLVTVNSGSSVASVRFAASGFPYPGGTGAGIHCSFSYSIA